MSDSVRPHRRQSTRLPCPWDSPGKNTRVGCHLLLQCVKVKSLSHVRLIGTPWTAAYQAPPSMGFSRQEYWSDVPLPSPIYMLPYLKSRDITLPTKVHLIKAMVFWVVTYGCESWAIKKAEHRRINAFELWCWRRLNWMELCLWSLSKVFILLSWNDTPLIYILMSKFHSTAYIFCYVGAFKSICLNGYILKYFTK